MSRDATALIRCEECRTPTPLLQITVTVSYETGNAEPDRALCPTCATQEAVNAA